MDQHISLSILTPAVPSRINQVSALHSELARQIGDLPVENLVLLDNKRRTVGEKRDALLRAARGDYVAFVDDDDWIAPDYVDSLIRAIHNQPDVVTFLQQATVNGETFNVEFSLGNVNEMQNGTKTIKRNAWHVCAWRRTLAILSHFPAINYGEDWVYASKLCALSGLTSKHIPKVLHYYRHSSTTTEAPAPTALKSDFICTR